jgi:KipI family sensor histidine kinase inhibitor
MRASIPAGEVRPLGDRAFLIGVVDPAAGRALAEQLTEALSGAAEVVCGAATVMVHATDATAELAALRATATAVCAVPGHQRDRGDAPDKPDTHETPGRLVTVPCRFDGPDLHEVASQAGCGAEAVVALLTGGRLTVGVTGFSPGFAYLDGLPSPLDRVPRRARPRPAVPAGSVAIANGQAAIYPTASPGGWHLVGRTGISLFSALAPPYALLAPGDQVRFTVAGAGERTEPEPVVPPPWSLPPDARRVLEIEAPGLRAVVQDGGRRGVATVGVPEAGPADPVAFELANRLAGNATGAATLELLGGGTRVRCLGRCHVAVVGAAPEVAVDGMPVSAGQLLPLAAGQVLQVRRQHGGCRSYLSVAGGFLGPEWFGSLATDELTGLGAGPLPAGAVLHAGTWAPPLGDHLVAGAATDVEPSSPVELRVVPGPHAEQFATDALAQLAAAAFVVQGASNRVGLRLRAASGAPALRRRSGGGRLDSHGVVTGVVQVPPDGEPVVLLPDHATLGGYPVLAVVASADHGLLGQCAPGTGVRLVPITPAEADEARRAARREVAGAVVGTYPLAVD